MDDGCRFQPLIFQGVPNWPFYIAGFFAQGQIKRRAERLILGAFLVRLGPAERHFLKRRSPKPDMFFGWKPGGGGLVVENGQKKVYSG